MEPLLVAQLQYQTDMAPVVPPERRDGELLGTGDGTVEGPKVRGTIRWSFFERECPFDPGFLDGPPVQLPEGDYLCETNPGGVIETDDGASIQFDAKGFARRRPSEEGQGVWSVASTVRFATSDPRYLWLNELLASYEGEFYEETGTATWRFYAPTAQLNQATA